ncbi:MAG TPA: hypothetical protein VGL75_08590 [Acidothermaceae bacterium]
MIETVSLPLSSWVFQWRDDGYWRELCLAQHDDELAGRFNPPADDWVEWTGTTYHLSRAESALSTTGWRLVYSELPRDCSPSVVLVDGTNPPIVVLGGLWMSEWVGGGLPATVTVGTDSWALSPSRIRGIFNAGSDPQSRGWVGFR